MKYLKCSKEEFFKAEEVLAKKFYDGWGTILDDGTTYYNQHWTILSGKVIAVLKDILIDYDTYLEENYSNPKCDVDYQECKKCRYYSKSYKKCDSCSIINIEPFLTEGRIAYQEEFKDSFLRYLEKRHQKSIEYKQVAIEKLKEELAKNEQELEELKTYVITL